MEGTERERRGWEWEWGRIFRTRRSTGGVQSAITPGAFIKKDV